MTTVLPWQLSTTMATVYNHGDCLTMAAVYSHGKCLTMATVYNHGNCLQPCETPSQGKTETGDFLDVDYLHIPPRRRFVM